VNKSQLLAQIKASLGGRVSEEINYKKKNITSGARKDFENVTNLV
jgi:ATP-dependent Zn protease